jgi:hypothetical protein
VRCRVTTVVYGHDNDVAIGLVGCERFGTRLTYAPSCRLPRPANVRVETRQGAPDAAYVGDTTQMSNDAPVKVDDHGLLYRRTKLESQYGVTFELYRPADGDPTPRYPMRWVATRRDANGIKHKSNPCPW